ncbi:hypothetical protein AcW1_000610 [Taiwanofungus camphoratus]|nr:hypothetical protein AcW1_000610 [Antrodia cinnamomea]
MNPDSVNRYIARLTHSLNHAMAISMKRNPHSPKSQFVRAVLLVKGVHFYGFHSSYSPFLKILIADPIFVNRAVTIMQSGTIMKTHFRVYESHLSYLLQFMCDFGLYGCGWIDLGEIWQRGQDEAQYRGQASVCTLESEARVGENALKPSPHFRQSRMPLEADAVAHQILNRHLLNARNMHHKLTIPAKPLPLEPLVLSVRELWEDERRRRLAKGLSPSPEIPKDPSEKSRGRGAEWIAEARWWEEIRKRIEKEQGKEQVFSTGKGWERWVMTTFESIEALWEDEWRVWKPGRGDDDAAMEEQAGENEIQVNPYDASRVYEPWSQERGYNPGKTEVDVDEEMLSSQTMNQLVENEEAEWQKRVGGHGANDEYTLEDDDAAEDGPPPDIQSNDLQEDGSSEARERSPSSPVQRPNPFAEAWNKLAGPPRHRSSSIVSTDTSRTPRARMATTPFATPPRVLTHRTAPDVIDIFSPGVETATHSQVASLSAASTKTINMASFVPTVEESHGQEGGGVAVLPLGGPYADPKVHHSADPGSASVPFLVRPAPNFETTETLNDKRHHSARLTRIGDECNRSSKRRRPSPTIAMSKDHLSNSSHSSSSVLYTSSSEEIASQYTNSVPLTLADGCRTNPNRYVYAHLPPSTSELVGSVDNYGIPSKIYRDPYYSKQSDVPEKPREYAGLVFHLKGGDVLEEWHSASRTLVDNSALKRTTKLHSIGISGWEYASSAPSPGRVRGWLEDEKYQKYNSNPRPKQTSQIEGPTQLNPYGLKGSLAKRSKLTPERQNMSVFALEIFALSRDDRRPDPAIDEIVAVFYSFRDSDVDYSDGDGAFVCDSGIIVVENAQFDMHRLRSTSFETVPTELDLLNRLVDVVVDIDPDVIVGWEVQAASWGYLSARADTYGLDIGDQISRAPGRHIGVGSDQWGMRTMSTFKVAGRHVLNLWRIMRAEQNFTSYTFENVVFHILRRRVPRYSSRTLTEWYYSTVPNHTSNILHYFSRRASMVLEILDMADVITKNVEFARVFGVDFFSVLSRGSQFKVESFMFRIAKPESFVLLSPSKQDVGKQNAAECMPLIMEPLSAFYNSPLVVLDFQSLYPSIMIAYNYCYSTCLGRITDFKGQNKFGVTELRQPVGLLDTLHDHINVAPNGIMYVKQDVRKGLLGRMLTELLDTRVMVKQAMKGVKDDKALRRILDARQLGLKFIANVTYGYTSATYSGRMPAVEIADSIVQSGRETLEKAIRVIDSTEKWGAKVVYGDTDSLFVYLRGKTKEQAFRIGYDMAEAITALNPAPVKLKFEKVMRTVYLPCVLMAKKRYVGFKFENPDDKEPGFDAKGIETVRRDGIPAQQKMTETCLKILFRTQDLSKVKDYCCRSWTQIMENKVSIQDFIFAKEVRMGTYSDKIPPPPGVTVAARRMVEDPNDEPQYGERIPYVIVRGEPNSRLVDRAVAPDELLKNSQKHLDAAYYISRVLIPPLERIFNLVGADVRSWYDEMPKALRADQPDPLLLSPRKLKKNVDAANALKIDEHFSTTHCILCGALTPEGLCEVCRLDPQISISGLLSRLHLTEDRLRNVQMICGSCTGTARTEPIKCDSLDCPWLFERRKVENKADSLVVIENLIKELEGERQDAED